MNSAMSPFGIIDWAENGHAQPCQGLASQAAPGSVVGGPPAYLDAHGIRYVPTASLDSIEEPEVSAPSQLVPMGRSADPQPVSQKELDSRVDERIRRFMAGKADLSSRSYASDLSARSYAAELGSRDEAMLRSRSERLQELRDRVRSSRDTDDIRVRSARDTDDIRVRSGRRDPLDEEVRRAGARSYRGGDYDADDRRSRARAYDDLDDPRSMDQDAGAELRALRKQMEADVASVRRGGLAASAAPGRKLSQPVASRVARAREELRKGKGIDF